MASAENPVLQQQLPHGVRVALPELVLRPELLVEVGVRRRPAALIGVPRPDGGDGGDLLQVLQEWSGMPEPAFEGPRGKARRWRASAWRSDWDVCSMRPERLHHADGGVVAQRRRRSARPSAPGLIESNSRLATDVQVSLARHLAKELPRPAVEAKAGGGVGAGGGAGFGSCGASRSATSNPAATVLLRKVSISKTPERSYRGCQESSHFPIQLLGSHSEGSCCDPRPLHVRSRGGVRSQCPVAWKGVPATLPRPAPALCRALGAALPAQAARGSSQRQRFRRARWEPARCQAHCGPSTRARGLVQGH
mmetsp:Transcript_9370/g.28962  ORF Transcript_9370/g.28962 Transcript_9370/m.28962 type:complete len:308 (+) Transcript_9370:122-1045(+)